MDSNLWTLIIVAGLGFAVICGLAMLSSNYTLGTSPRPLATVSMARHAGRPRARYAKPLLSSHSTYLLGARVRTCLRSRDLCSAAGARKVKLRRW